jgi:hypothetical protein
METLVCKSSSGFEWLPEELIQHIFWYLDARELVLIGRVCKLFHALHHDELLWRGLFEKKWPMIYHAITGAQSRWCFTSTESNMFLFFMEMVPAVSSIQSPNVTTTDNSSGESSSDDDMGWSKQKSRKKIKVTSPDNSPTMRDDDMADLRTIEDENSGTEDSDDFVKEKGYLIQATRYEIHCLINMMKLYSKNTTLQREICYVFRRLCYQPAGNHPSTMTILIPCRSCYKSGRYQPETNSTRRRNSVDSKFDERISQ